MLDRRRAELRCRRPGRQPPQVILERTHSGGPLRRHPQRVPLSVRFDHPPRWITPSVTTNGSSALSHGHRGRFERMRATASPSPDAASMRQEGGTVARRTATTRAASAD
jgi:hypothetical protein